MRDIAIVVIIIGVFFAWKHHEDTKRAPMPTCAGGQGRNNGIVAGEPAPKTATNNTRRRFQHPIMQYVTDLPVPVRMLRNKKA